ncbi:hypothetical protein JBE04_22690 [Streptomyces sp. PRKS01-29]|nr:hypothetical protein [Streptomyces sabulosicollis]
MKGTAREAAKAGAAPALAATGTIDAVGQSAPLPAQPVSGGVSAPA